jgi:LacI family transcriptional regulator
MLNNRTRVTMRQIAEVIGVTHATVSLALSNHPRISTELREKIQAKALEMGYKPDPLLTVLAHYRHNRPQSSVRAAIAWPNCWTNPKELRGLREFDAYWKGAFECAEKFGYRLEEFIIDKTMPLHRLEKILITRNIKGILIPPHRADHGLEKFNFDHFSAVRLGRSVERPELHVVTSDQSANTVTAFRKMRAKGYTRIGYVGFHSPMRMFTAGFLQAYLEVPESERLPLMLFPNWGPDPNPREIIAWVKANKPQAIITEIRELPEILANAGYRVPEDIALVALSIMDGNISAGIDQNSIEVGRVAMLMVISLINDFAQGIPTIFRQVLVEGSWVDGPECPPFADRKK